MNKHAGTRAHPDKARWTLPYHINADEVERAYKKHLSDFRTWNAKEHAENWLGYPENIGRQLCIDETSLSRGMWVISPLSWLMHFFLIYSARFLLGSCSVPARYLNESKSRQFRDSTETLPTHSRARARNLSGRNVTTACRLSIPKIIKKQILFAQFKEKQYLCSRNWVIGFVCSFLFAPASRRTNSVHIDKSVYCA